jgi:DNA-binding MarR family transcriptional regulator
MQGYLSAMSTESSQLQQEIRQTVPFDSAAHEAVLGVLRTADLLKRRIGEVLEAHGVSAQQFNVLRILRGAGERGIPTLEIGDRMIEQSPGITRLIDRLEERGWAERARCVEDRRVVYCRITEKGLTLLDQLDRPMHGLEAVIIEPLDEAEQRVLIGLLDRIRGSAPARNCDGELVEPA